MAAMKNIFFRDGNKLFYCYLMYLQLYVLVLIDYESFYFLKRFIYSIYHLF